MTASDSAQWVYDHWAQISTSATLLVYLISTITVGLKDHPREGEGRLSFFWRIAGQVAFVTFKNLYGTWKLPLAAQPAISVWPGIEPVASPVPTIQDRNQSLSTDSADASNQCVNQAQPSGPESPKVGPG